MVDEPCRGKEQFPILGKLIVRLQRERSTRIQVFLHPSTQVDTLQFENIFKVQEETLLLMRRIENEFMRGPLSQVMKANLLTEVEASVRELEQKVLVVSNTREILELKTNDAKNINQIPARPSLTPFFSGRDDELADLLELLEKYGSATIVF